MRKLFVSRLCILFICLFSSVLVVYSVVLVICLVFICGGIISLVGLVCMFSSVGLGCVSMFCMVCFRFFEWVMVCL